MRDKVFDMKKRLFVEEVYSAIAQYKKIQAAEPAESVRLMRSTDVDAVVIVAASAILGLGQNDMLFMSRVFREQITDTLFLNRGDQDDAATVRRVQ